MKESVDICLRVLVVAVSFFLSNFARSFTLFVARANGLQFSDQQRKEQHGGEELQLMDGWREIDAVRSPRNARTHKLLTAGDGEGGRGTFTQSETMLCALVASARFAKRRKRKTSVVSGHQANFIKREINFLEILMTI